MVSSREAKPLPRSNRAPPLPAKFSRLPPFLPNSNRQNILVRQRGLVVRQFPLVVSKLCRAQSNPRFLIQSNHRGFIERKSFRIAAAFFTMFCSRIINQNPPHQLRGNCKKMCRGFPNSYFFGQSISDRLRESARSFATCGLGVHGAKIAACRCNSS